VFGRGLFQTMYEAPSSLAAYLPLTFEWNVVALVLALIGLFSGGWALLLLVPLLTTWTLCVSGALKAPIEPLFRGLKARALIALLIYLGPIVRGWTRLKWRVKESNAVDHTAAEPVEQEPRIDWRERSLFLSYWGEHSEEKELLIARLMEFLVPRKYFLMMDEGWSDWDLKISRGLWSRAYVLVCTENHGGEKRVQRVRCAMRLSRLSAFVLRCVAGATAVALIAGEPVLGTLLALGGLALFGYIANETLRFGRIMHRVIEHVAVESGHIPMTRQPAK
jgi:hypothetical protein